MPESKDTSDCFNDFSQNKETANYDKLIDIGDQ